MAALGDDASAIALSLAISTGARAGEYLGLKWQDVGWQAGAVTVQRALVWQRTGGGWYFSEPKTPQSRRTIPVPASLTRRFHEHKRRQAEGRLEAGPDWHNHDLVFTRKDGRPLKLRRLRDSFKAALKAAGLPLGLRLYDLRHSCATLLMAAGENPKVVSERLGHANIAITLGTYTHVLPGMQQQATERLGKAIFGGAGTP